MEEQRYRIVFKGELKGRIEAEEVVERLVSTFRLPEARARFLVLEGSRRVIKRDLDQRYAERYRAALEKIGMVVKVEPMGRRRELSLLPLETGAAAESAPRTAGSVASFTTVFEPTRCPACGSMRVESGVCRDCGVVRDEHRLQRQVSRGDAADRGRSTTAVSNPYASPKADLHHKPGEGELRGPRRVPAGHGWSWIARGFWHFKTNPLTWILALIAFVGISFALAVIPIVGGLVYGVLSAVLIAGLMFGAREQDRGRDFRMGHLFAGFRDNLGSLALVGLLYLAGSLLIGILIGGLIIGTMMPLVAATTGGPMSELQDLGALLPALNPVTLIALAVGTLLFIPLMMAFLFAPALVMLGRLGATEAMKQSFMGCLKNMLPFLVFGALAFLLLIAGAVPLGLGLLVVWPTLTAAIYSAYRDIYFD